MTSRFNCVGKLLSGTVILAALSTAGCASHYYSVDDPYYHDTHRWNRHEEVYYQQWATENHVDRHRDFRNLNQEDQRRYWDWRHNHDHDRNHGRDKDHDHDHDRDHQ